MLHPTRAHRLAGLTLFVVLVAAGVAGCRTTQTLNADCVAAPNADATCPTCTADSDCVIVSNPCHDSAACTHRKRKPELAVTLIGCNRENIVPPPESCGCVAGACKPR